MLHFLPPTRRKGMTQARATRIFLRENGRCYLCGNQVRGEAWEIEHPDALALGGSDDDADLRVVHVRCHKGKSSGDKAAIAKRNRIITQGWAGKQKGRPMPGSKASGLRKRMDGRVERRDKETT